LIRDFSQKFYKDLIVRYKDIDNIVIISSSDVDISEQSLYLNNLIPRGVNIFSVVFDKKNDDFERADKIFEDLKNYSFS
jgi:hypothetical protein